MVRICKLVEFGGDQLKSQLGRVWDLGPVKVEKDPGSNSLYISGKKRLFDSAMLNLSDFKRAVMQMGAEKPIILKFAVSGDRGEYGLSPLKFDEQVPCRYKDISYNFDEIVLGFDIIPKGKELSIFNDISNKSERAGDTKPLFWASLF